MSDFIEGYLPVSNNDYFPRLPVSEANQSIGVMCKEYQDGYCYVIIKKDGIDYQYLNKYNHWGYFYMAEKFDLRIQAMMKMNELFPRQSNFVEFVPTLDKGALPCG